MEGLSQLTKFGGFIKHLPLPRLNFLNHPKAFLIILASLLFTIIGNSQSIEGLVLDSITRAPLPFANVFLNNTTIGTVSDTNGKFALNNINSRGSYELVISFVGYQSTLLGINIADRNINVGQVELVPSQVKLSEVEIKTTRDKEWEKQVKKFKKIFLGDDKQAANSTIENPWVLDFPPQENKKSFVCKASAPLEITNNSLGYKVFFYLNDFLSDKKGYLIEGKAHFEALTSTNESEQSQWETNRQTAYWHSPHHLFKAMIDHKIKGEGFYLYTEAPEFKNNTVRSPYFFNELGLSVIAYDTIGLVTHNTVNNIYGIVSRGPIEVHYHKEKVPVRTYRDIGYPVSWITLLDDTLFVGRNGYPLAPTKLIVSGAMSNDRVARMLPIDYQPAGQAPTGSIDLSWFQEKVYVQTDKPYYYPGEPLWFKGYINYATPAWKDSLSQTIHVELINPNKELITSRLLKIDSGSFHNGFILPDSLTSGMYYLRVYTNLNRNFGDSTLYLKPIPLLNMTDRINPKGSVASNTIDGPLKIAANKMEYKPREKIELSIQLKDDDGEPMGGNFSVSVTDATQVVPIVTSPSIMEQFPLQKVKRIRYNNFLDYPIEYGFSFSGQFLNDEGEPEKTLLNVTQFNPRNFMVTSSGDRGIFKVDNLDFYDSAKFSIQAADAKGNSYGTFKLLPTDNAPINYLPSLGMPAFEETASPQRIISEYEVPKDARILNEVVIKDTKIDETRQTRPYGKPDYVLKAKDINTAYGNLLYTLPGKFPGLIVRESPNMTNGKRVGGVIWVIYSTRFPSLGMPREVMVTVNDVPVNRDRPAETIANIDPSTVVSIEYTARINVLYGEQGAGGILAIYTKTGPSIIENEEIKNLKVLTVPGYSPARKFKSIDYSNPKIDATIPDYRSTIYWQPDLTIPSETGSAKISFFASDLPGLYHVIVEGVTNDGTPVHGVYTIKVNK